ncbi:peptidyl-prolyl cis-trans isomerase cyclophilin type [Gloeomargarita lithophora Alchichica-D10]|uniref:Peptidyl-prolyl cis-trans isomerase n=1 Tax=Gloeomargarita lithophora Alchichica-D10 TaxID=1188229 RepID=A0A1J0ADX4_9CYAN|nr:peptidylprolyl isomerase [Gloeomargarita lithophora]APB34112.1 peptidyl-prolyl cis-trans isomerase cyclophilin type [Gloeomargarita lithophora Alchichica-D10]
MGRFLLASLMLLYLVGCQANADSISSTPTSEGTIAMSSTNCNIPPELVQPLQGYPCLNGTATVDLVVNGQAITLEVNGVDAPVTAGNFVDLVQRGFYNNLTFHRVVREPQPFVVQGGDPKGNGTGGFIDPQTKRERVIPLEIKPADGKQAVYGRTFPEQNIRQAPQLKHNRGALAMARSQNPNSASSQFYITLAETSFLDGNYAVFGYVTKGMETVDKIKQGDRITSATVTKGLENLTTIK